MNRVSLPALDGRTALGWLAALGVTRLLDRFTDDTPRLSWSPQDGSAVLHSERCATVDDVVAALQGIVDAIPEGGLVPGVPASFPRDVPSRFRLTPGEVRAYLAEAEQRLGAGSDERAELETWFSSLLTDVALGSEGRCSMSLYFAPSGQQTVTTMFESPLKRVRENPEVLREALVGWRRYPGVTGEYLDHRVLFDAGDAPDGTSRERGVPGATWLAVMSYPCFRTTGARGRPVTTGWHRKGARQPVLVLPLWSAPLRPSAVVALLEHPAVAELADDGTSLSETLRASGVFDVGRYRRRQITGRTFAGVLAPAP